MKEETRENLDMMQRYFQVGMDPKETSCGGWVGRQNVLKSFSLIQNIDFKYLENFFSMISSI